MCASPLTRAEFLDQVFTSSFAGQVAKRFAFAGGEVGAVYTLGRRPLAGVFSPVILYVATFAPTQREGWHDFGIDYYEQPVASTEEAAQRLAAFTREQAAQFRASCRPQ